MRVKRCSKRRSHPYTKNNCSVVDEFLNNETLTMNGAVTLKTTHSALVGKYLRIISLKCTLCPRKIDTFLKRLFLCHKYAKTPYFVVLAFM